MFQNFRNPSGKNLDLQAKMYFVKKFASGKNRVYINFTETNF